MYFQIIHVMNLEKKLKLLTKVISMLIKEPMKMVVIFCYLGIIASDKTTVNF